MKHLWWLMVWLWLPMLAVAADGGERDRLERRDARRADRTQRSEVRWTAACEAAEGAPEDGKSARCQMRAETDLVNRRARWIDVRRRLDAFGTPGAEVQVLYATNREAWPRHRRWYRARDADRVEYGLATIVIPEAHPQGKLERGLRVDRVEVLTEAAFRDRLRETTAEREVLTYVHGYNNSFEYAVRRAAQLSHDLDPELVPVLFSWPSHGGTLFASAKYTFDENAAARSSLALADALHTVLTATDAPVTLVAHSMGGRVVSEALLDLELEGRQVRTFDHLVLAAPDVDSAVFSRRYLGLALDASEHVTVYCANDDRALKLSRGVHGGYDRLGSCREPGLAGLQRARVEVVDASRLYVDMLDHDKVASSPRLIADLRWVVRGVSASDPRRGLTDRTTRFELPP